MQGISHFIIEIKDPFKDKIEVGNVELFIDKRIMRERSANRFGVVVNSPAMGCDNPLPEGTEVLIDPTALYRQLYNAGEQESIHLVDAKKMYYKVEPDMIVLYRESAESEWKGYKDNLVVSFIENKPKEVSGLIITTPKEEFEKGKAIVKYRNAFLESQGIENGQEVFINPSCGIAVFFKEETVYWVRSRDILAV